MVRNVGIAVAAFVLLYVVASVATGQPELLRTRVALTLLIPFVIVVVVREFLSRRALLRAGRDLAATKEQLVQKEKLAAMGQLASGVAHELNNPLQGVLGYAELMLAAKPAELETEELRAIRDNANRAAGIVRNLLTFAGRNANARGWHQINVIVRDALAGRHGELAGAGTDLRLAVGDRLPLVYVDQIRLADVIANLVRNAAAAIDARRQGNSISIVPPSARGEIVVSTRLEHNPDRIILEVADNGTGLKSEDLNRIFDPFFTTQEVGSGTGLGLSMCYGIVRQHGGHISARNRPTGGAVFTVDLPVMAESVIAASSAAPGVPPPPEDFVAPPPDPVFEIVEPDEHEARTSRLDPTAPSRRAGRRKALVVDDEESNAALVRRVLAGAGYDVESTTLSRRALAMIERTAYDAVVADVKMPELSGQELYARVCQIRPEMARRFIFITGDIDGEDTRQFLKETRCSYFLKPFNLEKLTAAVDTLTGARSSDTMS